MKNFFFGIPALALLLVGCDDGSADPNDVASAKPDATAASKPDATEPTTIPTSYPAPAPTPTGFHCPIPAVTVAPFSVGTAPANMYRFLINSEQFSCFSSGSAGPTDCRSPANGFRRSYTDFWCCLNTVPVPTTVGGNVKSAPSAYLLSPSLSCESASISIAAAGQVALCSSDGIFMGWDCNSG